MPENSLATERAALHKSLSFPEKTARKLFFKFADQLEGGQLTIVEPQETFIFGKPGPLNATMEIHHTKVYADWVLGGSLGTGEAYVRGEWDSPDLTQCVRLFARNINVVNDSESFISRIFSPLLRFWHHLNRNTRSGSRKNIEAHYDLGNDFFELFLDETMMYSAAIFPTPDADLHTAQLKKLETICKSLDLQPTDHLLEIGTGWGALAIYAAENFGCQVTTTTLSKEQFKKTQERIKAKGLEDKITLLLEDYRDLTGTYDKLVSIEMIEAVGHEYIPEYIKTCSERLKPNGLFLLQVITIPDQRYDRARKDIDFIKRYIFPGSCIPSVQRVINSAAKTDFRLLNFSEFSRDYARTLTCWAKALEENREAAEKLTSPDFYRMFQFYFAYCAGGFAEASIGVAQMLLAKPLNRQQMPTIHETKPLSSLASFGVSSS